MYDALKIERGLYFINFYAQKRDGLVIYLNDQPYLNPQNFIYDIFDVRSVSV